MILFMVPAVIIFLLIVSIAYIRSYKINKKGMFRNMLLLNLVPSLLFIGFIEFVVVPDNGAQYASSLYPLFLVCWIAPANLLVNRKLKKYNE